VPVSQAWGAFITPVWPNEPTRHHRKNGKVILLSYDGENQVHPLGLQHQLGPFTQVCTSQEKSGAYSLYKNKSLSSIVTFKFQSW